MGIRWFMCSNEMIKKSIAVLIILFVLLYAIYTGFLKVNSELIGVLSEIPSKIQGFENYEKHLHKAYSKIKTATWDEYRQEELEDLEFRIRQAQVVKVALEKLEKLNQLKD